jgi:hypothetical protein
MDSLHSETGRADRRMPWGWLRKGADDGMSAVMGDNGVVYEDVGAWVRA